MAPIFKYAVMTATPDARRGERVNVGIVVFRKGALDVRFAELAKVRALAGGDWDGYAADVRRRLTERFSDVTDAEKAIGEEPRIDPIFQVTDLAWFTAANPEAYETLVNEILTALVLRPKGEVRPKSTRINTEIAMQLRQIKVLAKRDETIDDHKVVRDYTVSKKEDLIADFALKNGAMHVAATLDLRKANVRLDEAALKAIVLDKAKGLFKGSKVQRIGVYAVPAGAKQQFKSHIELLKDYADKTFNWANDNDRKAFTASLRKAAASPFKFEPTP